MGKTLKDHSCEECKRLIPKGTDTSEIAITGCVYYHGECFDNYCRKNRFFSFIGQRGHIW